MASAVQRQRQTHARPPRPASPAQLRVRAEFAERSRAAAAMGRPQARAPQVVYVNAPAPKRKKSKKKFPTIHLLDWVVPIKVAKEVIWGRKDGSGGVNLTGAWAVSKTSKGMTGALQEAGNILSLETIGLHPHWGQTGKHTWDLRLPVENGGLYLVGQVVKKVAPTKAINKLAVKAQLMALDQVYVVL